MTRKEFLAELAEVRDEFEWTLREDPRGAGGHIRAVPKADRRIVLDPMGAVCYVHYRQTLKPSDWARAGEILGLAAPGELAAAANDQTWAGTGVLREPVVYLQRLRQRLEHAVGLDQSASTASG
jgi:hypothetical protein